MLAKGGWRLVAITWLSVPSSTTRKILQGNIFAAQNMDGTSYTSRSVLKGVELFLEKGMIWRIRNSRFVYIWKDPWIPRGSTCQPCSRQDHSLLQRVSQLIDPATGQWDIDLSHFFTQMMLVLLLYPFHFVITWKIYCCLVLWSERII